MAAAALLMLYGPFPTPLPGNPWVRHPAPALFRAFLKISRLFRVTGESKEDMLFKM
jgi:hypothetical protein